MTWLGGFLGLDVVVKLLVCLGLGTLGFVVALCLVSFVCVSLWCFVGFYGGLALRRLSLI